MAETADVLPLGLSSMNGCFWHLAEVYISIFTATKQAPEENNFHFRKADPRYK
jgi:hypothetical protein